MIYWAGRSSDDVHVIVERYPSVTLAGRKMDTQAVPGRNGDLLFEQNAYQNYIQAYEVYMSAERIRLPRAMREVANWLCGPSGYQKLEDDYDVETYRRAYFAGPLDVESIMHRFGRATIEFSCQPQRFLRAGDQTVELSHSIHGAPADHRCRHGRRYADGGKCDRDHQQYAEGHRCARLGHAERLLRRV